MGTVTSITEATGGKVGGVMSWVHAPASLRTGIMISLGSNSSVGRDRACGPSDRLLFAVSLTLIRLQLRWNGVPGAAVFLWERGLSSKRNGAR